MSLLTICQDAARRCRFNSVPSVAVSSNDLDVQQLVAFAQDTGVELMERHDWRNLKKEMTLTGDGGTLQWSLPSDWKRFVPSDRSQGGQLVSMSRPLVPMMGPINDMQLARFKAYPTVLIWPVWRMIGNYVEIWPALPSGEVVKSWYYSKNWISNAAGSATSPSFSNDDDYSLINEDTIMKGVVWRWKQSKGLDYAEEFRAYEASIERNVTQQDTDRVVNMSNTAASWDNFWPGLITMPPA